MVFSNYKYVSAAGVISIVFLLVFRDSIFKNEILTWISIFILSIFAVVFIRIFSSSD